VQGREEFNELFGQLALAPSVSRVVVVADPVSALLDYSN
jgi:hypothetical protein